MTPLARRLYRVVGGFWLASWFVNAPGAPGFLDNFSDALAVPLVHEGFPGWLTDPHVAYAIYLSPLGALPSLVWPARLARIAAVWMLAAAAGALLHLETCSDATFTTALWVGGWLVWLTRVADRDDAAFLAMARGTAHAVLGLVFLGGFLGKCTPAYVDGSAFYGLYFAREKGFPYPWLRAHYAESTLRDVAKAFSRAALAGEGVLTLSPLLPTRFVLGTFVVTMVTMMVARNCHLFSVLGSLLGMMIAAEMVRRVEAARS